MKSSTNQICVGAAKLMDVVGVKHPMSTDVTNVKKNGKITPKKIDNWTECNAYEVEHQCLADLIQIECMYNPRPETQECCEILLGEIEFVIEKERKHCSAPDVFSHPCPFDDSGNIK